jgi:hypothetical protein
MSQFQKFTPYSSMKNMKQFLKYFLWNYLQDMVVMWLPLTWLKKFAFEVKTTSMYVKDLEIQPFKLNIMFLLKY